MGTLVALTVMVATVKVILFFQHQEVSRGGKSVGLRARGPYFEFLCCPKVLDLEQIVISAGLSFPSGY